MLLHEISSGGGPEQAEVVQLMRQECPILEYLHFFTYPGRSHNLSADDDITTNAEFRSLGDDYTVTDDYDPSEVSFSLKIFGKDLTVDQAYLDGLGLPGGVDAAQAVGSALGVQRRRFARNLGRNLNNYIINGNSSTSAKQFEGMRRVISQQLGASQTLDSLGANGLAVVMGNDNAAKAAQQKFVEALQDLISAVAGGATVLQMNRKIINRLSTIAREQCTTTIDQFGRPITSFNGVPLLPAGFDRTGAELLPFTETLGTSTSKCSTVLAMRSEEMAYWSFKTTPSGIKVYDPIRVGNKYTQTVELQLDSGEPFNARSLAALPGVMLS